MPHRGNRDEASRKKAQKCWTKGNWPAGVTIRFAKTTMKDNDDEDNDGRANGAERAVQQRGWWAHQDLNLEPTDYESAALTVEL